MKQWRGWIIVSLTLACRHAPPADGAAPFSLVVLTQQSAVQDSTIRGIVISEDRRVRIAEARIWLAGDTATRVYSAADGRFTIPRVAPGPHVLIVRRIGYRALEQPFQMPARNGAAVAVLLAEQVIRLDGPPDQTEGRRSRLENVP